MRRTTSEGAQCEGSTCEGGRWERCAPHFPCACRGASDADLRGIFNLEDLKEYGRKKGWCPYFLARHAIAFANVVVYNYQYMLDPKIAALVSREMEDKSIVVFDEAHNIDNVCIEALSVTLDRRLLDAAAGNLTALGSSVKQMKAADASRLQDEYARLMSGLAPGVGGAAGGAGAGSAAAGAGAAAAAAGAGAGAGAGAAAGARCHRAAIVHAVPRRAASSVLSRRCRWRRAARPTAAPGGCAGGSDPWQHPQRGAVRALHEACRQVSAGEALDWAWHCRGTRAGHPPPAAIPHTTQEKIKVASVTSETPPRFLHDMATELAIDVKPLKFAYSRLNSLLRTLQITNVDDFGPIQLVADFTTLLATYTAGFMVLTEPFNARTPHIPDPVMQLTCLGARRTHPRRRRIAAQQSAPLRLTDRRRVPRGAPRLPKVPVRHPDVRHAVPAGHVPPHAQFQSRRTRVPGDEHRQALYLPSHRHQGRRSHGPHDQV